MGTEEVSIWTTNYQAVKPKPLVFLIDGTHGFTMTYSSIYQCKPALLKSIYKIYRKAVIKIQSLDLLAKKYFAQALLGKGVAMATP